METWGLVCGLLILSALAAVLVAAAVLGVVAIVQMIRDELR